MKLTKSVADLQTLYESDPPAFMVHGGGVYLNSEILF